MLCTLVVAILADYVKCWLIVGVELKWLKVITSVPDLLKQAAEPAGFLSSVGKGDILRFGGGESNETLAVWFEWYNATRYLENVTS
jgi:hypothetical protein